MEVKNYMPRLMDGILKRNLDFYGAVLLEGCKWCGKSTTAKRAAKSLIEMQNPATAENNKMIAKNDPTILLSGEKPRLIDEWQDTPEIWDAIRYDVDNTGLAGQYILTGSVTPKKNKPSHSGAGRIVRVRMRPMTLFESGDSNGSVSLRKLFDRGGLGFNEEGDGSEPKLGSEAKLGPEEIARLCVRGGWPVSVKRNPENAGRVAQDYLDTILNDETVRKPENDVIFTPAKMRTVIRSLARNIATPVTMKTIIDDVAEAGESLSDKTLSLYLEILERIHVLDDIEPWSPQLRSKTTIRAGVKRCFADPSLVAAALLATENDLRLDSRTFGLVFETMALRDLKVYAESLEGKLYYYRDKAGRESDAVIHLSDGRWCAVEIKLGSDEVSIREGIKSLKRFKENINTEVMREPEFMMVLTATTNYAYVEDGIVIVPIGCLRD